MIKEWSYYILIINNIKTNNYDLKETNESFNFQ